MSITIFRKCVLQQYGLNHLGWHKVNIVRRKLCIFNGTTQPPSFWRVESYVCLCFRLSCREAIQPSLFGGYSLPSISVGGHPEGLPLTTYSKCAAVTELRPKSFQRMQHQILLSWKFFWMVESYVSLRFRPFEDPVITTCSRKILREYGASCLRVYYNLKLLTSTLLP